MKDNQMGTEVDKKITGEMAADAIRKYIFVGFNSIGFAAAGYLILMAFLTVQTGGAIQGY